MSTTPATFADLAGPGPDSIIVAGFLARYREPTRSHYAAICRQWCDWCRSHGVKPMDATRAHIELWARELEEVQGLKLSTVAGKLGCITQLYKFAVIDGTHHRVSVEHLNRYLAEFDYRYSTRKMTDEARMRKLMGQVEGRRLTYKRVTAG